MAPSQSRQVQPNHLTVDDAFRVLSLAYSDHEVQSIRAAESSEHRQSKLAFEYNSQFGADKDAMYRYRDVIKAFIGKSRTCVWNWSLILAAVKKWDSTCLGRLLSNSKSFGQKAVRQAASNLQQLLQDARNAKRNMKTGARTPNWLMEIVQGIDLGPEKNRDLGQMTSIR